MPQPEGLTTEKKDSGKDWSAIGQQISGPKPPKTMMEGAGYDQC